MSESARLGIVEDQKLVLALLRQLCETTFGYVIAFAVENAAAAYELAPMAKPDLVLLDINLPDEDGVVAGLKLKKNQPGLKVVVISAECTEYTLYRVRASGLEGYVDKSSDPVAIKTAISDVLAGKRFFSPLVAESRRKAAAQGNDFSKVLSELEQLILPLFGMGYPDEDIAAIMAIKADTVKWHRSRIMGKLGIHTATGLVHYCLEKGFIQARPDGDMRPAGRPKLA